MRSKPADKQIDHTHLSPEALALLTKRSQASSRRDPAITARGGNEPAPLSSAQEMVWLAAQIDKSTTAYNRCAAMRISGHLNQAALHRAVSGIVARHSILRSYVSMEDGMPMLRANENASLEWSEIDISAVAADERADRIDELLAIEVRTPFDLDRGPWIRAGILQEDETTATLFISTHHIATDGWSDAVMFAELATFYEAFARDKTPALEPLPIQFADFAVWQREREKRPDLAEHVAYWRDQMAGAPTTQHLPVDRPRLGLPDLAAGQVKRRIDQNVATALTEIGREQRATTAMTMLAAFQALQFRLSGQADTVTGLSIAGRTTPEVEGLIGLFSTVVPLRVTIDRSMTFRSLVDAVRKAVLDSHANDVPVLAILESLPLAANARHPEIAQTLFNFRNMPAVKPSLAGLEVETLEVFNGGSVADLQLEVIEKDEGIDCVLRFRTDVFDESTASRLLRNYATLMESIVRKPDECVGKLQLLDERERNQLLIDFNGPVRVYPPASGIDDLFVQQAEKTPDATAISFENGSLTYRELAQSSDALGRTLQQKGVRSGDFVGVCMERSPQMIVSLLAILKSGAAFVPLDPDYPPERLAHMLADTKPALLIADEVGSSLLGSLGTEVLIVGDEWIDKSYADATPFFVERPADAVACVLYTSGSTGLPKGVLSTHRGIVNNLRAMQDLYDLTATDCMLQQTSLGFDAAAWEIFWPLSVGARTYVARPGGQRDAGYVIHTIAEQGIATVGFAPSMLKVMLRMPAFTGNRSIKRVMSYGEVLSPGLVKDLFTQMPGIEIHNLYGPTETSIAITTWNCERESTRRTIPVGRTVTNAEVYILDPGFEPVPIGVEGEVMIGGICVSNGYHDRPDLTAERFVTHPFRPESGDKVYRTGDIARFAADGAIEYVGRRDHQIKIRGLRVELEEVEAALSLLPGITESVVIVTTDSDDEPRLIAYVAADERAGSPVGMRRALEKRLPPQFLPAQIIPLSELPHSLNGKIDRQRLPDPSSVVQGSVSVLTQARNEMEARLLTIWKDLLKVPDIGVTDSFFNLGGHSLLAARMLQRVADEVGVNISLRVFYGSPAIETLAQLIAGGNRSKGEKKHSPVLKVRESADGSPVLFYFNGQPSGGGRYAERLAPYLPAAQGLYIVPVPIFDGPVKVESLATGMIDVIRSEQPAGPYLIGGNCFGATLAIEIAQQLAAAGDEVALLALVHPDARNPMHLGFRAIRRAGLLGGLPEEFHFDEFSGPVHYTARATREIWRELRRHTPDERKARLKQMVHWVGDFTSRNAKKPLAAWSSLQKQEAREQDDIMNNNFLDCLPDSAAEADGTVRGEDELKAHAEYMSAAWTEYTPRAYDGPVAIIWPVAGPANPPWNPRALWKRLTPKLDWHFVPGNHWTMLHKHFDHSARALGASVERARKSL